MSLFLTKSSREQAVTYFPLRTYSRVRDIVEHGDEILDGAALCVGALRMTLVYNDYGVVIEDKLHHGKLVTVVVSIFKV